MTAKLLIKSILCSLALTTTVYAQDTQWVKNPDPTQPMTCSTLCVNNGLLPVRGGKIGATNESFSVCVREMDGLRVGYEAPGAFAGQCDVGHDGQAKAGPVYSCLCSKNLIEATK